MPILLTPQTNYQTAVDRGAERLRLCVPEELELLGAARIADNVYGLCVLDAEFVVDATSGRVMLKDHHGVLARDVNLRWQILMLHYLAGTASEIPREMTSWVSFADLPDGRGYAPVYTGRVIRRLCGAVARTRGAFVEAAARAGGHPAAVGDEGFVFQAFPRLPVMIAWYEGDDELPSDASFLYPDNVLSLLPVEDVIVLSECIVSRLQGKDW